MLIITTTPQGRACCISQTIMLVTQLSHIADYTLLSVVTWANISINVMMDVKLTVSLCIPKNGYQAW